VTTRLLTLLCLAFALALPAQAQLFGTDCQNAPYTDGATNYSLYSENFKNEAYADALPNLRWIIDCEPDFRGTARRNFDRLEDIYLAFAEQATDPAQKTAYLDSVLIVRDYKTPILQSAGVEIDEHALLIERGRFLQTHEASLPGRDREVIDLYQQAYDMNAEATDAWTIQFLLADLLRQRNVDRVETMVAEVRPRYSDDAEMISYLDQIMLSAFPTAEARYELRSRQLSENPDDQELVLEVFNLASELRDTETILRLKPQILEMDPSFEVLRNLARIAADEGDTAESQELLTRAVALAETDEQRRDIYYEIGRQEQNAGRLSAARAAYRQALSVDSDYGPALIGIGDLYVTAVSNCGSFELNDRAVYILAVDYYNRAAQDAAVASVAGQKAGSYRRYFPTREQVFFQNLQPGSSYSIRGGCYGWIGESTTLRTAD
jgi:tetratricopeptide (TPR) repeat protein